jgi:hypothetical protein
MLTTTLLLHAQRRWTDEINTHLWAYAIRVANDSRNYAPTSKDDTCPMSKFCNTASVPKVQNQHHFGCPTYVLRKELQDHKKIMIKHMIIFVAPRLSGIDNQLDHNTPPLGWVNNNITETTSSGKIIWRSKKPVKRCQF